MFILTALWGGEVHAGYKRQHDQAQDKPVSKKAYYLRSAAIPLDLMLSAGSGEHECYEYRWTDKRPSRPNDIQPLPSTTPLIHIHSFERFPVGGLLSVKNLCPGPSYSMPPCW